LSLLGLFRKTSVRISAKRLGGVSAAQLGGLPRAFGGAAGVGDTSLLSLSTKPPFHGDNFRG